MSPLAITLIVIAVTAAALAFSVGVERVRATEPERPWWSYPFVWVGASICVTMLAAIVFPRLLGFAFVFLPLIWLRGVGRRTPPRSTPPDEDR